MASGVPRDVMAELGNGNSSNEARLALLERRFAIPPSPAASRETASQTSYPAAREATPGPEVVSLDAGRAEPTWHSLDALELSTDGGMKKKRRRTSIGPAQLGARPGASPARAGVSPRDKDGEKLPPASPPSSRRPLNTISRYFSSVSANNSCDGVAQAEAALKAQTAALVAAETEVARLRLSLEEEQRNAQSASKALKVAEHNCCAAERELSDAKCAGARVWGPAPRACQRPDWRHLNAAGEGRRLLAVGREAGMGNPRPMPPAEQGWHV